MVDSKGIEPSNLTDANRALSQLSYEPILTLKTIENSMFFDKRMRTARLTGEVHAPMRR